MTAYEVSEKKNKILRRINYLQDYLCNNAGTVLLTNDEVEDIIEILNDSVNVLDEQLKKVIVN